MIPPLLAQARVNLTGNARDLWVAGIGHTRASRSPISRSSAARSGGDAGRARGGAAAARKATREFVAWLEAAGAVQDRSVRHRQGQLHLVPAERAPRADDLGGRGRLLRARARPRLAALRLEEHRNRDLPQLPATRSPEEFDRRADAGGRPAAWRSSDREILPVQRHMEPALREHLRRFVPESSATSSRSDALRADAAYTHFYHWWDLAQMRDEPHPSPIRRGPLLYNIFDSRAEGMATGVEEMFMHAGLYDDNPRSREIVWIMLAQRAARGLGSLYAHANEMTMAGADPRRLDAARLDERDPELLGFEQHLYLRQPGYGTSYVTGKYLLDNAHGRSAKPRTASCCATSSKSSTRSGTSP